MEKSDELKNVGIKICRWYYIDDIIKFEYFDFDGI